MAKKILIAWRHDVWLRGLTVVAILLIVIAFWIPPTAVIDGSILAAVGEIAGIMAIIELDKALDKGIDATVKHNNTELSVSNPDKEEKEKTQLHHYETNE